MIASHGLALSLVLVLAAAAVSPVRIAAPIPPPRAVSAAIPCDAEEVDPWVREMHHRVISFDELAVYAIERYGPPLTCDGVVTAEFDGNSFGTLRLTFAGDATFVIETQPPEASIATLQTPAGFEDPAEVRRVLEAYTFDIGVDIDWTTPTVSEDGDERIESFWDPDDGLNASASLIFTAGRLVGVRFSMAL